MRERLISFETVKVAIEKGFKVINFLKLDDEKPKNLYSNYNPKEYQPWYLEITQPQLKDWLIETYGIFLWVQPIKFKNIYKLNFVYRIIDHREVEFSDEILFNHQFNSSDNIFEDYFKATEEGLKEGIKKI